MANLGGRGPGGSTTILTVLPEGTVVKKGDVLATLDGSALVELLRQQQHHHRAGAEPAICRHNSTMRSCSGSSRLPRRHRAGDGQGYGRVSIALARSIYLRAVDHLTWTERMRSKGYSAGAIVSEEHAVAQLALALEQKLTTLELFQRFTLRKTEKNLQGQVKSAETALGNETLRLQRQLERLELYQKQVDRCTIPRSSRRCACFTTRTQALAVERRQSMKEPPFDNGRPFSFAGLRKWRFGGGQRVSR